MFLWVEFLRWSAACNIHNTVATASIYQKILWFVFDLICVVSSKVFSELPKFYLIIPIFEHNYVYLSQTLRINVFILNAVLDIAPLCSTSWFNEGKQKIILSDQFSVGECQE